jgi:hypothetical protein
VQIYKKSAPRKRRRFNRFLRDSHASAAAITQKKLFRADGVGRTNTRAGTAIYATAAVDNVNIACRDSFDRTFVDAGTARGTQIGTDFVSHFSILLVNDSRGEDNEL